MPGDRGLLAHPTSTNIPKLGGVFQSFLGMKNCLLWHMVYHGRGKAYCGQNVALIVGPLKDPFKTKGMWTYRKPEGKRTLSMIQIYCCRPWLAALEALGQMDLVAMEESPPGTRVTS